MSSQTSGDTTQGSEVGLQLAAHESDEPDFSLLKRGFEDTVNNLQSFINQAQDNYNTRYALWAGQSADGRKHAREGSKIDPTPWENASDLQVFLTDEAINAKVAMMGLSFLSAQISATPTEGNDIKRAKDVSAFMRWLIASQIPEVDREVELLANYVQEMGVGAIGTFWETKQNKILATVTTDQLQQQFPNLDMQQLLFVDDASDDIIAIFEEQYGCSRAKAKKILASLRKTGEATVPMLGKEKSYPVIRAFDLNHNLFIPQDSTDIENARAIYRVEYMTAEQLRSYVHTANWDESWVEAAINTVRGKLITLTNNEYNQPVSRSFMYQESRFTDLIGVCFAYQKLSDEDGNSGIYLTIFNPLLPPDQTQDGYAKTGLLGYADGEYPFTLFRREYLSRKLHDTRGIPEPGKPLQQQIKVHKDSLIDNASLQICPPLLYPQGRPVLRWGAGVRHPERRPGEVHYAPVPPYSPSNKESESQLQNDFNRYNGLASADGDPTAMAAKNQWENKKYLNKWGDVMKRIWSRYRQYGNDTVYFRVVGVTQQDPIEFHKGEQDEEFDFNLTFDVGSLNDERNAQKLKSLNEIFQMFDRYGQIDYSQALELGVNTIDPAWGVLIQPKDAGTQKVVSEMQDKLAKVFAGQEQDISPGTPPDLGLQILQGYVQGDPVVQKRLQDKSDPFGERLMRIQKQLSFSKQQTQINPAIGRLGTKPAQV